MNEVFDVLDYNLGILFATFAEGSLSLFLYFWIVKILCDDFKKMLNELAFNLQIWFFDSHKIFENGHILELDNNVSGNLVV
jgi:hypothetical protein